MAPPLHLSAPYREPCNGWGRPPLSGPCYQHRKAIEKAIVVYENITKVDGAIPENGGDYTCEDALTSGCPDACSEIRLPDSATNGNCYALPVTGTAVGAVVNDAGYVVGDGVGLTIDGTYYPALTIPAGTVGAFGSILACDTVMFSGDPNRYEVAVGLSDVAAGGTIILTSGLRVAMAAQEHAITILQRTKDMSSCHKEGWKAVRAQKVWHGRYGYRSHQNKCQDNTIPIYTDPMCTDTSYQFETGPYAVDHRYLTVTVESKYTVTEVLMAKCNRVYTISKDTGKQSEMVCNDNGGADPYLSEAKLHLGKSNGSILDMISSYRTHAGDIVQLESQWIKTQSADGSAVWLQADSDVGDPPGARYRVDMDLSAGTMMFQQLYGGVVFEQEEWNIPHYGPLHFKRTLVYRAETYVWELTASLSDTYFFGELQADVFALLESWDLANDAIYPWRTDLQCLRVPVVRIDEQFGSPEVQTNCTGYVDPLNTSTGAVYGIPLPAGYGVGPCGEGSFFAFKMSNYSSNCKPFHKGVWTPTNIPSSATWWTETNIDGSIGGCGVQPYPKGAFVMFLEDTMYAQKWCCTKESYPSINFFRPCGSDLMVSSDTPCAVDGSQYHWNGSSAARPKAWSICGHIAIASVEESGGTVTVTLAEDPQYLEAGYYVSLVVYILEGGDPYHRNTTDSGKEVLSVDHGLKQFTYHGALPTGSPTHVISHIIDGITNMGEGPKDAPHYKWNDADAKGDYTYQHFLNECSGTAQAQTASYCLSSYPHCLKRSPCFPSVICITTPGSTEIFGNAKVYEMGSIITPNMVWQGIAVTSVPDPFWVAPQRCEYGEPSDPCVYDPPAECFPVMVETLCALPNGAPALPNGWPGYSSPAFGECEEDFWI